MSNFAEVPWIR